MNERIKQLAEQATIYIEPTPTSGEGWVFDKEKFARLIVQECIQLNGKELSITAIERLLPLYTKHFGTNV